MDLGIKRWSPTLPDKYIFNLKSWTGNKLKSSIGYGRNKYDEYKRDGRLYPLKLKNNKFLISMQSKKMEFVESIPRELIETVKEFPDHHWHILSCAARTDYKIFMELMESNPAIAYMMALNWMFIPNKHAQRKSRSLIKRKQKKIIKDMGFPETPSNIKILNKINKEELNTGFLLKLRTLMNRDDKKINNALRHIDKLTLPFVMLLSDYSDNLSSEIINELYDFKKHEMWIIRRYLRDINIINNEDENAHHNEFHSVDAIY